jgi:hypothetical protein
MHAWPSSRYVTSTRSTSSPAAIVPIPFPSAEPASTVPISRPRYAGGVARWATVMAPTEQATAGAPLATKNPTYSASAVVTAGAFHIARLMAPMPR